MKIIHGIATDADFSGTLMESLCILELSHGFSNTTRNKKGVKLLHITYV